MDREDKLIIPLRERVHAVLTGACFTRVGISEWLRRWGWKTDSITTYKTPFEVLINFGVAIPPKSGWLADWQELGMINVARYAGGQNSGYRYPSFSWSDGRFLHRVLAEVASSLAWFDRFNTPALCIEYMRANTYDLAAPGPRHALEYLASLPAETERICCLTQFEWPFPRPFSRAIFDVHWQGPLPVVEGGDPRELE